MCLMALLMQLAFFGRGTIYCFLCAWSSRSFQRGFSTGNRNPNPNSRWTPGSDRTLHRDAGILSHDAITWGPLRCTPYAKREGQTKGSLGTCLPVFFCVSFVFGSIWDLVYSGQTTGSNHEDEGASSSALLDIYISRPSSPSATVTVPEKEVCMTSWYHI